MFAENLETSPILLSEIAINSVFFGNIEINS